MQIRHLKRIIFLIVLLQVGKLSAQQRGYMLAEGEMPQKFSSSLQESYNEGASSTITKADRARIRRSKKKFVLTSNYFLQNILSSGEVIYNTPVTIYLNRILSEISDTSSYVVPTEIYLLKSPRPNAFATHQGLIFITVGLLAQLENEAQLAFVIAHELSHVVKRHSINEHLETDPRLNGTSRMSQQSIDKYISRMSSYSKRMELQADSIAMCHLQESKFNLDSALTVFNILRYSYLPFEETAFDRSFFESAHYKIPEIHFSDTTIAIKAATDVNDRSSTHPRISTRTSAIDTLRSGAKIKPGEAFVVSQTLFAMSKRHCRDEVLRLQLHRGNYLRAFYNAYSMHLKYPDDEYYSSCMAHALYGYAKYKNIDQRSWLPEKEEKEGEISKYFHFFESFTADQFATLALSSMISLNQHTNDPFIYSLIINLTQDLLHVNNIRFEDLLLSTVQPPSAISSTDTINKDIPKYQLAIEKTEHKQVFHLHALSNTDTTVVRQIFHDAKASLAGSVISIDTVQVLPDTSVSFQRRRWSQRMFPQRSRKVALGLEKVVYVNPQFFSLDERKGLKHLYSAESKSTLSNSINKNAQYSNLNVDVISPSLFNRYSTNHLNDLGKINSLVSEILDIQEHDFRIRFIPVGRTNSDELSNKYKSNYFCYSGVLSLKSPQQNVGQRLFWSLWSGYGFPFMLASVLSPDYSSFYYHVLFDVSKGEIVYVDEHLTHAKMREGVMNSIMYDKMTQFAKKPRK